LTVRRELIAGVGAVLVITALFGCEINTGDSNLYGLIEKVPVVPGERDSLITILIDGLSDMPGCFGYIVAKDPVDSDAIPVGLRQAHAANSRHLASACHRPLVQVANAGVYKLD
jgi:hypothetical protein